MKIKPTYARITVAILTLTACYAMAGPQDTWYVSRSIPFGSNPTNTVGTPDGLELTDNDRLIVADQLNGMIQVFDITGNYVTNWPCPGGVRDVTYASNGQFYAVGDFDEVRVYSSVGSFVTNYGSQGSGPVQFDNPYAVAVSSNNEIFVADRMNHRIQVIDASGNFVREWGSYGTSEDEFDNPLGIDIGADGLVYVADRDNIRIKVFTQTGTFVRQDDVEGVTPLSVSVSEYGVSTYHSGLYLYYRDPSSNVIQKLERAATITASDIKRDGLYSCLNLTGKGVDILKRSYRTMDPAGAVNAIPDPVLYSVTQRADTAWIDIDFSVEDADDATVAIAPLAFMDGKTNLSSIIPMVTFMEGSGSVIGSNKASGARNVLTWNAGADWVTNFAYVNIEILAKDARNLIGLHFLTIPANSPNPQLTISRSPVTAGELLDVWAWLIAIGDSEVSLTTGTVSAVSGPYSGLMLAHSTDAQNVTTSNGLDFICDRLSVRLATTGEVAIAKEATSVGTITAWTPRSQVGPHPKMVNEYGFDTGSWPVDSWWFVPVP